MNAPILVVGATGRQGGAVADHLLQRKRQVRALTRNPEGARARALEKRGAQLVRGDLDDRESIDKAVAGAGAVFSVQDPWLHGVEAEIRQGQQLAEAAKQAGVARVVYGSVASFENSGLAHFESKGIIEGHMRQLGLQVTSIRPAFFMDSLVASSDQRAPYSRGALRRGLRGGKVQLTAVDDIGRAAADAFETPVGSREEIIEIAGDELSAPEIEQTFLRVVGRKPRVIDVPFVLMRLFNREAYENFRWIGERGWHLDLGQARTARPWVQRFEPWLRRQHERSGVGPRG